ncbi:MAG: lipid A biosynthesis acyltransferase [Rhodoferax sp.]|nr:lipid A biosynthesis acyltransferase [Rhodoferax sp.]
MPATRPRGRPSDGRLRAMLRSVLLRLSLLAMRLLALLPLPVLRGLGWLLGQALYRGLASRRHVVLTNLRLCQPDGSARLRGLRARAHFVRFAQAWLDRAWLWHGSERQLQRRLRLTGSSPALQALHGSGPLVLFAPHFVGLDAGWTALTRGIPRRFATLYTRQGDPAVDAWVRAGRQRFGAPRLFLRVGGVRPVLAGLREGDALYLLPDMNFGLDESVFVPFYGVPAATVTSLSRLARLARAPVLPVVTRLTGQGYEVCVGPAWEDYPTADPVHDTAVMNRRLELLIDAMPEQYYWVHRRFKDRPPGQPPVY